MSRTFAQTLFKDPTSTLDDLREAVTTLEDVIPIARRVLGDNDRLALKMRRNYAMVLYKDAGATLDDLREAVTTLEEIEPTARRVFGGAHPITVGIEGFLRNAQAALRARETPPPGGSA